MKFGVLVFPGSNCDHDAYWTVQQVARQPVTFLWHEAHDLENCDAIIVPGGFAYGDYLRTGAIAKFSPVIPSVTWKATTSVTRAPWRNCSGIRALCSAIRLPTDASPQEPIQTARWITLPASAALGATCWA